jgi:hypothetical protein
MEATSNTSIDIKAKNKARRKAKHARRVQNEVDLKKRIEELEAYKNNISSTNEAIGGKPTLTNETKNKCEFSYGLTRNELFEEFKKSIDLQFDNDHKIYFDEIDKLYTINRELQFKFDNLKAKCTCKTDSELQADLEAKQKDDLEKQAKEDEETKYYHERQAYKEFITEKFNKKFDKYIKTPNSHHMTAGFSTMQWNMLLNDRISVKCIVRAGILYESILNSQALNDAGIYPDPEREEDHFAFRVIFPQGHQIFKVSCSIPSDASGNFDKIKDDVPETLECALVGRDNHIIYCEELIYGDVRRFSSDEEVIEDLLRLFNAKGEFTFSENSY